MVRKKVINNKQTVVVIDGIRVQLTKPDLDGDGKSGGIEKIQQRTAGNVTEIQQPTEIGESLKEVNLDEIEPETGMSSMDMRARLGHIESSSVLGLDSLVNFRILDADAMGFTRQKKRLSVSLDGLGRKEAVQIITGREDQKSSRSFGEKFGNFMGFGKKER